MIGLIITVAAIVLAIFLARSMPQKTPVAAPVDQVETILKEKVSYYNKLPAEEQEAFRKEVQEFLEHVTITGVQTEVPDEDRVLVAASGIIPIFAFHGWKYPNLHEVLLYPQMFGENYSLEAGTDKNILGMVGTGPMNNVMILSKPALEEGFSNRTDKNNTAIHEFVHLLDKTDGTIDGVPELLTGKEYARPWLQLMHQQINAIHNNESDVNPYGATNEAEFLAVASEYFFERPLLFQQKHPELYALMEKIFRQQPRTDSANETTKIDTEIS